MGRITQAVKTPCTLNPRLDGIDRPNPTAPSRVCPRIRNSLGVTRTPLQVLDTVDDIHPASPIIRNIP